MKIPALILALMVTFGAIAQVYELSEVDQAPVFAKGKMTSTDFLRLYQTYPQEAIDAGAFGKVSLAFIVDSAGEVSQLSIKNSASATLNKEALRVAALFPYYTPAVKNGKAVATQLQFQMDFPESRLQELAGHAVAKAPLEENVDVAVGGKKSPLYVVNDKVLQENANINPEDITKIRIVKGQKAIDLYGMRAKDGLVLIETK